MTSKQLFINIASKNENQFIRKSERCVLQRWNHIFSSVVFLIFLIFIVSTDYKTRIHKI